MVYQYFNKTTIDKEEINFYSTGIIFLQELESPFKNYFGFNSDLDCDLDEFFEEVIYTLYFDETETDFEDTMDLNVLVKWLQARNKMRFVLALSILLFIIHQCTTLLIPREGSNFWKSVSLLIIDVFLTLVILGNLIIYSWLVNRYPSSVNKFNLASPIIIFSGSILANYFYFQQMNWVFN